MTDRIATALLSAAIVLGVLFALAVPEPQPGEFQYTRESGR